MKGLPHYQKQIPRLELCIEGRLAHRRDGNAILATRSQRDWKKKLALTQSCKEKEGMSDPKRKTLEASSTSLISSLGFRVFLKNRQGGS